MTDFSLIGSSTAVYGLKGTGKSNFVQYILSRPRYSAHLMVDVCREHDKLKRYIMEHRRGEEAEAELNQVLRRTVTDNDRSMRPEVVAVEEVSRFCSARKQPPEQLYELIDLARHYGVGLVTIARRPAQVHSDLTELADNIIFFKLKGENDKRKLNNMVAGLGDRVADLGDYEFIRLTPDYEVIEYDPVPELSTTGEL